MDKARRDPAKALEKLVSLITFVILLVYTVGILFAAPYSGFYLNPTIEKIEIIFIEDQSLLQVGDIVKEIDGITMEQFKADRRLILCANTEKGDTVEIKVERGEGLVTVQWVFPGFTTQEFLARLFSSWILAYVFAAAGFVAQLSIRPRDLKRNLFIYANYLMAIFLISGDLSFSHLWESSTVLHIVSWLMAPVFLHLHWIFPRPFRDIKWVWVFFYGAAFLLALGEGFHIINRGLYALGFIIAIGGSIILLFFHFLLQKGQRRIVAMLGLSVAMAFSFSLVSGIGVAVGVVFNIGWITVFSMPFMPLVYFYLVHRNRLGGLETRVNRLIAIYLFFILLVFLVAFIVFLAIQLHPTQETWVVLATVLAVAANILTIVFLPRFQTFVNQRVFGIKLPYRHLPETYSSRIVSSVTLPGLLKLLEEEIFPSLLIRQYAFLQSKDKKLTPILQKDISVDSFDFDFLAWHAGLSTLNLPPEQDWLRLILPLKVGDNTLGFWLLGKRDPDDLYPQAEIPILQSLADQTAIALSNIIQTEQVRKLYQSDIERNELERKNLSHELHDSVLNQLAILHNSLDGTSLPPAFLSSYEELKRRLREIVGNLRPPMLAYGLASAITDLADNLMERSGGKVKVIVEIKATEDRLPEPVEFHLYRIVQEACENALRHANASQIKISGSLSPQQVDLSIEDNGVGFASENQLELDALLAKNHFGLAGMMERAQLIGAIIEVRSGPQMGTIIRVTWLRKE